MFCIGFRDLLEPNDRGSGQLSGGPPLPWLYGSKGDCSHRSRIRAKPNPPQQLHAQGSEKETRNLRVEPVAQSADRPGRQSPGQLGLLMSVLKLHLQQVWRMVPTCFSSTRHCLQDTQGSLKNKTTLSNLNPKGCLPGPVLPSPFSSSSLF